MEVMRVLINENKGFIVYAGIKATLDEMEDEQVGALFRGMVDYFCTGEDPGFKGILKFAFIPIRQQMDRDTDKYTQKCERMRENARKRWDANDSNCMQMDANGGNTNTNKNTNTKTNKKINTNTKAVETADEHPSLSSFSFEAVSYLNEKAGSKYTVTGKVNEQIEKLMDAGYTMEDVKAVVDRKVEDWLGDPKMIGYLRPRTLFGEKFAEYLKAPETSHVTETKKKVNRSELEAKRSEKLEAIRSVDDQIEELRNSPGGLKENYSEWQDLLDQKMVLEQVVENIGKRLGG